VATAALSADLVPNYLIPVSAVQGSSVQKITTLSQMAAVHRN